MQKINLLLILAATISNHLHQRETQTYRMQISLIKAEFLLTMLVCIDWTLDVKQLKPDKS